MDAEGGIRRVLPKLIVPKTTRLYKIPQIIKLYKTKQYKFINNSKS